MMSIRKPKTRQTSNDNAHLPRGRHSRGLSILLMSLALLSACSEKQDPATSKQAQSVEQILENSSFPDDAYQNSKKQALEIITSLFENAIVRSKHLIEVTDSFVKKPNEDTHAQARSAFADAHQAYNESQLGRLFGLEHPLLDLDDASQGYHSVTSRIDNHPLLPGYLDSVAGYPNSGLINSEINIDIETLIKEHHFSDEAYVTLGFPAYEFLLNGDPELSDAGWKRYELKGEPADLKAAQRRISYLRLLSKQIHEDIRREADQWLEEDGFYRKNLIGMAALSYEDVATRVNDPAALKEFLANEAQHLSNDEAQAIEAAWKALAETLSPAAKPEETTPSDNSSQE
jgi:hypothetical protein